MSPTSAETKARSMLPSPPPPIIPAGRGGMSSPPPNLPLQTPTHDSNDGPAAALVSNIHNSLGSEPQHTRTSDVEVVSPMKTAADVAPAPRTAQGTSSHDVQFTTGSAHVPSAQQKEAHSSWQTRCKEAFVTVQKYLSEKRIAPPATELFFWQALEHIIGRLVLNNHADKLTVVIASFRSCDSEVKVRETLKPLLKSLEQWLI
jgi:hypothetical protein